MQPGSNGLEQGHVPSVEYAESRGLLCCSPAAGTRQRAARSEVTATGTLRCRRVGLTLCRTGLPGTAFVVLAICGLRTNGIHSLSIGRVRIASSAIATGDTLGLQEAARCYVTIANVPGVVTKEQGVEIGKMKFASLSECSTACSAQVGCNSFTACWEWKLCFFKDKYLSRNATLQQVGFGCQSFAALPCKSYHVPGTVFLPTPPFKAQGQRMTFYMYRAQSAAEYPMENVNMADLAGVLWYLHHEVLKVVPRRYDINRILRYKVTVMSPPGSKFGAFVAFDAGQCTVPGCSTIWNTSGFTVGCQTLDVYHRLLGNYVSDFDERIIPQQPPHLESTVLHGRQLEGRLDNASGGRALGQRALLATPYRDGLHGGVWFSLPRGGRCPVPTGTRTCTYTYEPAGEISLDELTGILRPQEGIRTYEDFWKNAHGKCMAEVQQGRRKATCAPRIEYNYLTDRGVGCNFWDGILDLRQAQMRMDRVRQLFRERYPAIATDIGEPSCE